MKKTFVIFTCTRDRALALVAAQNLVALGASVTICTDYLDAFDRSGFPASVRFTATIWPRNGNLNGKEAVVGILRELQSAAAYFGATWAGKCDSDTLVSAAMLARLDDAPDALGFASASRAWYGAAYVIRAACLPPVIAKADALADPPQDPAEKYPEDVTVGALLRAAGCNYEARSLGVHNNITDTAPAPGYLAVCYGFMASMPPPFLSPEDRRAECARRMAAAFTASQPVAA